MSPLDNGGNDDPVCAAIDAAEEVRDPLEGLVERTGGNPGAAFAPDVLERLAMLKREDRAAFEALRAQLKKAGCRVTALDDAIAEENGEAGARRRVRFAGRGGPALPPRVRGDEEAAMTLSPSAHATLDAEVVAAERDWSEASMDELAESARDIIGCRDVLGEFARAVSADIAGEDTNAKLLFIVATSRLLERPMHAAVKGPSAAGKSQLRSAVLKFFPPEDVVSFTTLSERALLYIEGDFAGKILSLGEACGAEEESLQNLLLRELMSEGMLRYPVARRVGNHIETVTIVKHGPCSFMVTTTRGALHPENETRVLSLEIADSPAQTRRVLQKVAQIEGLGVGASFSARLAWQNFQRWLARGERRVVIPFAETLADLVPASAVRMRRDFGQVLRAIKVHALLHREHRGRDGEGRIVAAESDYEAVRALMGPIVGASAGSALTPACAETHAALERLTAGMPSDDGVSAKAVGEELGIDTSAARRRLRIAEASGIAVNLETRPRQPGRYRPLPFAPAGGEALPPLPTAANVPTPSQRVDFAGKTDGKGPCQRLANAGVSVTDGKAMARPVANANTLENNGTTPPMAQWHALASSPDGKPKGKACPACSGTGCPWCQPKRFGLPPRCGR